MSTPHASASPSYIVGSSGSSAHNLSFELSSQGRYFTDEHNRTLLLRGANLSGLSKLPTTPNGFTHLAEGFYDHETVSFVGRPFPLEEAHEHFSRLRQWGLTFLRLVITWESLEHSGPGLYDTEYIEYLAQLIALMPRYGIKCFIDPHQDVWSRHTGGSGAPGWSLGLVGLDIRALKATGAAHAHNLHLAPDDPPPKVWPSGYCKLAAATMATVFWAGETFAPRRRVKRGLFEGGLGRGDESEEVGLQQFLQECMIEAFGKLADRVKDCQAVVGFEVMNEPHRGYVELHSPYAWDFKTDLAIGFFPSAAQSWALGSGHPVLIDHYGPSFPVTAKTHAVLMTPPGGRRAWKDDVGCIWEQHGVWAWDSSRGEHGQPVVLKAEYFHKHPETGKAVDWYHDFYWPFCAKFGERIGKANPAFSTFVGPIPNELCVEWPLEQRPRKLIYAPHWYDLQSLHTKALNFWSANVQGLAKGMFILNALYFGRSGLKKNYLVQIRNIINAGYRSIGELPVVIGETGVPFDLNGRAAFRTGDFSWQERQMDAICGALEENLVSFNLWNYNPLNNDEWGDSWNQENFSWFGQTSRTPDALAKAAEEGPDALLNVGARTLDAFERPYACKIAGIPLSAKFHFQTLHFTFTFANPLPPSTPHLTPKSKSDTRRPPLAGSPVLARETEIYLPRRRYGGPFRDGRLRVRIGKDDGEWRYDVEKQTLYFLHRKLEPDFVHSIKISVDGMGGELLGLSGQVWAIGAVLLAVLFAILRRGV